MQDKNFTIIEDIFDTDDSNNNEMELTFTMTMTYQNKNEGGIFFGFNL